jgi:hypothetical protein
MNRFVYQLIGVFVNDVAPNKALMRSLFLLLMISLYSLFLVNKTYKV